MRIDISKAERTHKMPLFPNESYKRVLVGAAYAAIGALGAFIFFKFLLMPLLPFILAWVTAMVIRPTVRRISKSTGISQRIVSFVCVLLFFLIIFGLFIGICSKAVGEIGGLSKTVLSGLADAVGDIFDYIENFSEKLPFLDGIENTETAEKVKNAIISMIETSVTEYSQRIPLAIVDFVSALPGIILFTAVLVMATFYMGNDVAKINLFIAGLIPEQSRPRLFEAKKRLFTAGARYIKAYVLILSITFTELLIGFLCLDIPYALTLSVIIALIDILPVLGVGTVLVPWAVVLLLRGDYYIGTGLLILFGVIWVVRQIIEPKIVGQSTGLSPLLTLLAMYTGFKFLGVSGLFVFPIAIVIAKSVISKE